MNSDREYVKNYIVDKLNHIVFDNNWKLSNQVGFEIFHKLQVQCKRYNGLQGNNHWMNTWIELAIVLDETLNEKGAIV